MGLGVRKDLAATVEDMDSDTGNDLAAMMSSVQRELSGHELVDIERASTGGDRAPQYNSTVSHMQPVAAHGQTAEIMDHEDSARATAFETVQAELNAIFSDRSLDDFFAHFGL